MVFASLIFLFQFLPPVLMTYFVIRKDLRNALLCAASLFFYAWGEGGYVLILIGSIIANSAFATAIRRCPPGPGRRMILVAAVMANLGLIGYFKYANFIAGNVSEVIVAMGLVPLTMASVHLPIGISFFTFQAMSCVIDTYRERYHNPPTLGRLAVLMSLFPHQIAGPIVRYSDIEDEIADRRVCLDNFIAGARRFVFGLGKKVLLANAVAVPADSIFGMPQEHLTFELAWLGTACYTLQIYLDFSGYTDMAIGLARMLGFHFPENFNYPYVSTSIRDFWRRWHMSLSAWFRDYVYIPLGGNKGSPIRVYFNLVTVFFLCGLWHGASWTFVIWGLYHGIFLAAERAGLERILGKLPKTCRMGYTLMVVAIGWVFFRSNTFDQAVGHLTAMAGFGLGDGSVYNVMQYLTTEAVLGIIVGTVACLPVVPALESAFRHVAGIPGGLREGFLQLGWSLARGAAQAAILLVSVMWLAGGSYNPFIYFRF